MQRRKTRVVDIGGIPLGGEHPVRVQSMTNLPTSDVDGQVQQILKCVEAGAEYMRITVPTLQDVKYFRKIQEQLKSPCHPGPDPGLARTSTAATQNSPCHPGPDRTSTESTQNSPCHPGLDPGLVRTATIPLIADVHFNPKIAIEVAKYADKVRINPGNYLKRSMFDVRCSSEEYVRLLNQAMKPLLVVCKSHGTALRIGTNHGSLSERIMEHYGDTPEGMVVATIEAIEACRLEDFHDIVLSLKSSNVRVMVEATRLLVERLDEKGWNYPVHLGVTEAGNDEEGRIKSAIGIGSLLVDGIGDTIRVSLTEDPEHEIPVAYNILQASRARITKTEYIACPGCGRTQFGLQETLNKVKKATSHLSGLKIAVMGCIVNGPGEMADADYGYVGAGNGKVHIYRGKEPVLKNIAEEDAVERMLQVIGGDEEARLSKGTP